MSKKTRWLYKKEAELLGLKPKENEGKRPNARYSITKEQWSTVLTFRDINQDELTVSGKSTLRDKKGNVVLEWTKTNKSQEDTLKALKEAVSSLKSSIKPNKQVSKPLGFKNNNLINQYTLTDYHLGMMAWGEETGSDWDLQIAEDTLVKFFEVAIKTSPNAKECVFAQIGDFLHWDGLDAVTPANKHVLDADTRFTKLVRVAIRVIRRVISMLLNKYETVNVIMAEGNHDPASSVWLRELLHSFYQEEPRLNINTNPDPYYCLTFGKVCLFYHHGHKRSIKNIDTVFVGKYKKEFGLSDFVYGHTGHLHHEHKLETNLMTLEQHRTLASKDAYASRGGYLSGRDSKVITYHKEFGEVGRNTFNINMLK